MAKKRHTGAFVLGSLIGGLAGAVLTLWKTPKSGAELRASLSGSGSDSARTMSTTDTTTTSTEERSFSNPVLSFVEKVAAPIPGVELGKLAKDDPLAAAAAPVRVSAADARPPESTFDPIEPEHGMAMASTDTPGVPDELPAAPAGTTGTADTTNAAGETVVYRSGTSVSSAGLAGEATAEPAEEATYDTTTGSEAHDATTEDLTSPAPQYAERIEEERSVETVTSGTAGVTDSTELGEEGAPSYEAVNPEEEATHDPVEGSEAPAATTEDLTSPAPQYTEQLAEERAPSPIDDGSADFPEPPSRDGTR